jgi:hypothetical protein
MKYYKHVAICTAGRWDRWKGDYCIGAIESSNLKTLWIQISLQSSHIDSSQGRFIYATLR